MSFKNCFRVGRQCLNIFKMLVIFYSCVLLSYNTCWPNPPLPPILSVSSCTPTLPQIDCSFISIQKRVSLQRISTEQRITKCNKVGHNPSYQGWTGKPSRRQEVQKLLKMVRDTPYSHCLESHKKKPISNYCRLHDCHSESPYKPLVDSVGCVLMMSLTLLASIIFPLLLSWCS